MGAGYAGSGGSGLGATNGVTVSVRGLLQVGQRNWVDWGFILAPRAMVIPLSRHGSAHRLSTSTQIVA